MHLEWAIVISAMAFAASTAAEPERPRIPHRHFFNSNNTKLDLSLLSGPSSSSSIVLSTEISTSGAYTSESPIPIPSPLTTLHETHPTTSFPAQSPTGSAVDTTSIGPPGVTSPPPASLTQGLSTVMSQTSIPSTNSSSSVDSIAPATTASLPEPSTALDKATFAHNSTAAAPTTVSIPSVVNPTGVQPAASTRPNGTTTQAEDRLPTAIVTKSSTTFSPATTQIPTKTTSAPPTNIPEFAPPANADKPTPEDLVPIEIGFLSQLNYTFVAINTLAATRISSLLPRVLADAGGFSADTVQVSSLMPYDTRDNWGYVTTLARLNYPRNLVEKLQIDLWSPNSGIYNSADVLVRDLAAQINPKIGIHGNFNPGVVGGPTGGAVPTSGPGPNDDTFDNNDRGDKSPQQKAATASIAIGAVGLGAISGAAMFAVARRYKQKRQSRGRSSSVADSKGSSARYPIAGGPALMRGGLLGREVSSHGRAVSDRDRLGRWRCGAGSANSGRTANISAPVATENSLGWYS